ncbi:hypothetical protein [Pseudogulbenkiania subflava]|uniref:Uncharacterized protein n=1 Tax=Pseudogulbenkiania subflava DSM 22618 TaxID=1123014 RepID=A0A1Y6BDR3_9NEIS|nr:hypothetical protein [Pseudogulbenkiania subflava]SMF04017.1 hypothetical protein SAMN02745746_00919 [Pseudogulbenkiania subflava DSM 22618]
MSGVRGRPPGLPKAPNSGRKKGAKNSKPIAPEAVREQLRTEIFQTYLAMGGVKWLEQIAKEHPLAFLSQCFSRIAPPVPKPEEAVPATVVNVNNLSDFEAARYVAFMLAQAIHAQDSPLPARTIEHQPAKPVPPPPYEPPAAAPIDVSTDSLEEQARQAAARELVANTIEQDMTTYHGSAAEQGIKKRRNLI